jgi:hypothetical protein
VSSLKSGKSILQTLTARISKGERRRLQWWKRQTGESAQQFVSLTFPRYSRAVRVYIDMSTLDDNLQKTSRDNRTSSWKGIQVCHS